MPQEIEDPHLHRVVHVRKVPRDLCLFLVHEQSGGSLVDGRRASALQHGTVPATLSEMSSDRMPCGGLLVPLYCTSVLEPHCV